MPLTREYAMCLTAYKACARARKRGGVTTKITKPIFQRFRDDLGVAKGMTEIQYKLYFWVDIQQVLSSKEIRDICALIEAQINLSK